MTRRNSVESLKMVGLNLNFSQNKKNTHLSNYRQEVLGLPLQDDSNTDDNKSTLKLRKISVRVQAKLEKLQAKVSMYEHKLASMPDAMKMGDNHDAVSLQKCRDAIDKIHSKMEHDSNTNQLPPLQIQIDKLPHTNEEIPKAKLISPAQKYLNKLPQTIVIQPYSHECEGDDVVKLLKRLKYDSVAKNLYLTNVPLGERGAVLVAEMLGENETLETLYMNGSGITDSGLVLIAFALETNKSLRKLSLSDNFITDKGMETLGNCLGRNSTLQELKLGNNNITKLGRCWGKVNVCKMNLFGNPISNVPKKYIGERRVSNCKMFPLKKFLKDKDEEIGMIEKRVLSTSYTQPDKDDMWRLKTIGYHNDFRDWLENLILDHSSFKLVLLGMKFDNRCKLRFFNNGYSHLIKDMFQFLFVGDEKYYDFARARKTLRIYDGLKLDDEDSKGEQN